METWQWPLTAAATDLLLRMPASTHKPGPLPAPKDAVKLAIKELMVRGAYRLETYQHQWGMPVTYLVPQQPPGLPPSLAGADAALRPFSPATVKDVLGNARKADPLLLAHLGGLFRDDGGGGDGGGGDGGGGGGE